MYSTLVPTYSKNRITLRCRNGTLIQVKDPVYLYTVFNTVHSLSYWHLVETVNVLPEFPQDLINPNYPHNY